MNPWWGCSRVDPGCERCYAETLAKRTGHDIWGPSKPRRFFEAKHWKEPLRWEAAARKGVAGVLGPGYPRLVFCASMADVFEDNPLLIEERKKLWPLIRSTPNLHWQILTKRADKIAVFLPEDWGLTGYPNVWLGVSVSESKGLWRLEELRKIPALVRFVSYEPALGPIEPDLTGIHWLIYGGESGPNFRYEDQQWAYSVAELCDVQGTVFFHKQWSGQKPGNRGNTLLRQRFPIYRLDQKHLLI